MSRLPKSGPDFRSLKDFGSLNQELAAYFVLAFLISWAIEIPLALSARGVIAITPPFWLHYLASFGPLAAAVMVTLARQGTPGLWNLFSGLAKWRFKWTYALFIFSPIAVFLFLVLLTRLFLGAWPDLASLGRADYLPYLGILTALLLWTLTYGLGEETGWRGFALPRLQATHSALKSSLILGVFWAAWHLPAIFYRDTYMAMGLLVIPMLITVAAVGSVVYTWLYNGTRGSLLAPVIFHGLFDFFSVWEDAIIAPGMVMTILMIFWAARVYKLFGGESLSPEGKTIVEE